jgi:hypothetical protein
MEEAMRKCQECKKKIPAKRLEILPDTKYCIKCAQTHGPQKPVGFMVYDAKAGGELVTVNPKDEETLRRAQRAHRHEY